MKKNDKLQKAAALALRVLMGCMPTGNYSGARRERQIERINEAMHALTVALGRAVYFDDGEGGE